MRLKDREISDETGIQAIINNAVVCRLGIVNGNTPYVVPLCFGFKDNTLYFHSALKGLKVECLKNNPNVCFEFDLNTEVKESENACDWGMVYQSVIGFGKAKFIEDSNEKRNALGIIMAHYSDKQFEFPENEVKATAIISVEIESMTGKQAGF
jgi:nitroimidazol reductase NimA-like FMN-containing flavoprotein (pyridoxamine 5'-phosphate oxidase superfamily)